MAYEEMHDYIYCSICLDTNTRLFIFTNNKQKIFVNNIFKQSGYSQAQKINLEEYICYECRAHLDKTYKFIQRALTAQHILKEINQLGHLSPINFIKKIKQRDYKIRNILKLTIEPQPINYIFTENEQDLLIGNIKATRKKRTMERDEKGKKKRKDQSITIKGKRKKTDADETEDKLNKRKDESEDIIEIESEEIKVKREEDEIEIKIEDEMECEYTLQNGDTVSINDFHSDDPLITKKRNAAYKESNFMLTLSSLPKKRVRKQVNYKFTTTIPNDESDNSEKNTRINDQSSDFDPENSDNSSNESVVSIDLYNEYGRRLKRDLREYPMKCDDCDAIIHERRVHYHHYLEMHRDLEYPYSIKQGTFLCDICGLVSYKKSIHRNHVAAHSTEKRHKCPACPKKFHSRQHLAGHMRYHTDTKYECDYCGKKFVRKGDMRLHIRIHTGDKPYKCHICGAGFAHNGNVGIHIRANHQRAPRDKKAAVQKSTKTKKTNKHKRSSEGCESPSIPHKQPRKRKPKKLREKKEDDFESNS